MVCARIVRCEKYKSLSGGPLTAVLFSAVAALSIFVAIPYLLPPP
jgi:hypothetical protein